MKLNKNKVLSLLTTKEAELVKALKAAEATDAANLKAFVQTGYMAHLEAGLKDAEQRVKETAQTLARFKHAIKAAKAGKFVSTNGCSKVENYMGFDRQQTIHNARRIQNDLDAVRKQKALTKLSEGEVIDSKTSGVNLNGIL